MAGEWYCKLAGVTTGPLAPRELKALAVGGKLGPNDLVRHGDQGPWVPAVCVKGLLSPDSAGAGEPEAYVQPEAETVKRGPAKYSKPASRQVKSLPVAQPVEDPPPAPASKPAKASSKPAPVAVLRAGPVVVGTSADSVTARALGRTPVDPRKRKRNNLLAIGALVLAAVGLCVGGAFLLMRNRDGTEPVAAKSPGGSKADAAKTKAAGEGAEKPAPAESPEAAPSEADWVDASKRAVRRDDVRVQVLSARIGPAPAAAVDKPGTYLLITVQVQNSAEEKIVRFTPWSTGVRAEQPIQLADSAGKAYRLIMAGEEEPAHPTSSPSDKPAVPGDKLPGVGGEDNVKGPDVRPARGLAVKAERIPPGTSVEDVLVFETPQGSVEYLRLALPASAFGGKGRLCFQIPKKMIKTGDEPDEPAATENPFGPDKPGEGEPRPKPKAKPDEKKDPGEAAFEDMQRSLKEIGGEKEATPDFDFEKDLKNKPAPKTSEEKDDKKPAVTKPPKGAATGKRTTPADRD